MAPDLPEAVTAALARGREAYLRGDVAEAEREDQTALEAAERAGSVYGAIRAARYLGLCAYRRGESALSAQRLEAARDAAASAGWVAEELLVLNHLGATYRRLGRLEAADRTFRGALARAEGPHLRVARARLLGSFGAFMDDLGEEQAAAEYYGRYEELLAVLDDPSRLANAHGLVSRAARVRGDVATALAKAQAEVRLGDQVRQPLRQGRGWMHIGQALAAAGDFAEAEQAFVRAADNLRPANDARAPVHVAAACGRFYLGQGRIHEAHEQVDVAMAALTALPTSEAELRGRVSILAAEVASAAGLHGESLWHLGNAIEAQLARFEPISDPKLLPFTRRRRADLMELGRRLLRESGEVEREPDERHRVDELLARLSGPVPPGEPGVESVAEWRRRVRLGAETRWGRLLGDVFGALPDRTREELILADVVSQGPVGDLSRSLLLLFTVVERELRQRVFDSLTTPTVPGTSILHKLKSSRQPLGLGQLVDALVQPSSDRPDSDARSELQRRLPEPERLQALRSLRDKTRGLDGRELVSPIDWRNDLTHGHSWVKSRRDADAIRRAVSLGRRSPLKVALELVLN